MVSAHEYFTFDIPCTYRINDTVSGRYCLDIPIRNKRISEKMAARMFRQICFHIFRSTDTCTSTFYWWFGLGPFTKTRPLNHLNGHFGILKGIFSLVWLAFILFHVCLVHFLKKFSPLHIRKMPQKRRTNEMELRTCFKSLPETCSVNINVHGGE